MAQPPGGKDIALVSYGHLRSVIGTRRDDHLALCRRFEELLPTCLDRGVPNKITCSTMASDVPVS